MSPAARRSSAAGRLRRTRATMTLLFTCATGVCLALLLVLALQIDATSRSDQLDSDVVQRSGGLARAAYIDAGTLHLEPLREDELAVGADVVAVYRVSPVGGPAALVSLSGETGESPDAAWSAQLVDDVVAEQGSITRRTPPGGSGAPMAWAASPVWDGDTVGAVIVVAQSASSETAAHDRLAAGLTIGCLALLAVAALTGYLLSGRAMRPATEALARQEQFLTEAAHELRTPLASLRLLVEAASAGEAGRTLGAVDRLDRLITGLLARARVEAGTFVPERIPLRLDQLVQQVAETADGAERIRLTLEPLVVIGDPGLLEQAVRNLVDNAVRHAPDAPIDVAVTGDGLAVRDGGPGIPAAQRAAVLERGVGTGTGTGTGLAIVTWVADLHGAALTLADAPGGGLVVRLRFPASP